MHAPLEAYGALARELAGDNLQGLTVFGEVLSPRFDEPQSTAASVMVLGRIELELLRRIASHGPRLGGQRISAPLVMTPEYIVASLDSFPLELLEIHQEHATLHGRDYFKSLEIRPEHLRLQCERELKRILMRLRQGLLAAAGRDRFLTELEVDVGRHILRTLRGLLWLRGSKALVPRNDVISRCEKEIGGSLPGVRVALESRGEHGWNEFTALYQDVEKLAALANDTGGE